MHGIRGQVLSFSGDPFRESLGDCMRYHSDAVVLMDKGTITYVGPASEVQDGIPIRSYPDCLITAGFVDCHVHYPQVEMVASYGRQLLDWLTEYTFPTEERFRCPEHGRQVAEVYLKECLRNGVTTAMVYCTVFSESVDAFFQASSARNMRNIAGKVLMDRNAPEALLEAAQEGYDASQKLVDRWHGRGRSLYSVTPRFAPTSTPELLELAGALWKENPGTYLQTHVSETEAECAWVQELFPQHASYLDVYQHYGLLGPKSVLGHGIYLSDRERAHCQDSGVSIAHCPTSNLFLGSGHFDLAAACTLNGPPLRLGLGTDLGAGTSFSPLQTLSEAYKVAQMQGFSLSAPHAFYLATRGGARALHLEDRIGSVQVGMEADLVVLDLYSTPFIRYRMERCKSLEEVLFLQMMMGDDRAVFATYVAGSESYTRDS